MFFFQSSPKAADPSRPVYHHCSRSPPDLVVRSPEGLKPVQLQANQLWQTVLGDLERRVSKTAFDNWIKPAELVDFADGVATVAAANTFGASTLQSRYAETIAQALSDVIGRPVDVVFTVVTERNPNATGSVAGNGLEAPEQPATRPSVSTTTLNRGRGGRESTRPSSPAAKAESKGQLQLSSPTNHGLNDRYLFETYVVGKSNMFAHAASLAVAEHPGAQYNPLYIHGGVGLGKTHLLHAIGHRALELRPNMSVLYVSSERFTIDLIASIRAQRMEEFRARYRAIDLLMIDDIQFIGGKDSTQEEFFHTFNALYQDGKQVVISSDRPPGAIAGIEDRLRSRFEGGLTADVQPPDFEMRIAILRTKAEELKLRIPDDAIEYIAQRDQTNTRELEGALNRAIAYSRINNSPPTLALVIEALSDGRAGTRRDDIREADVLQAVSDYFQLPIAALTGRNRSKDVVLPRQIAMYLLREETHASLVDIGRALGGRDHTTAMHGIEKIESQLREDANLRTHVMSIRQNLLSSS